MSYVIVLRVSESYMKESVDAFIRFQFVHSFVGHVGTYVGCARNDAYQIQVC